MARDNDYYILDMEHWEKTSIYRLPHFVTVWNDKAYSPHAVSFGPYHHGKENLKSMEKHKLFALHLFLDRSRKSKENCIKCLHEVAQELKDSYSTLDHPWDNDTDQFLELLLRDGCFMLEVLRISAPDFDNWSEYPIKHPIFSQHGKLHIVPFIKRDMLMLENQLPLLVLLKLTVLGSIKENDVIKLILVCCGKNYKEKPRGNYKFMHVLDVYRWSLLPEKNSQNSGQGNPGNSRNEYLIRCATELHSAGVKFRTSNTGKLTDVSFERGILKLPVFGVDGTTETIFLNLIAFERFHVGVGDEVTSYIYLMDNLIHSEKDAAFLYKHEIIKNFYGSDEDVAKLFNSFSKDTPLTPSDSLVNVITKVNIYSRMPYNMWKAQFYDTYFRHPWSSISVVAAIFLFVLTIVQTVYCIMGFYKPS